jgi:hypothetical protein
MRSRLEARWAVLFETLGIPWEYEPQGFNLSNGQKYLPDFRLPTWNAWVEIKPDVPEEYIKGGQALERLSMDGGGTGLLFIGSPWPSEYRIEKWIWRGYHTGPDFIFARLAECRRCDGFCLFSDEEENGHVVEWAWGEIGPHSCGDHEKTPLNTRGSAPKLFAAYDAARGARFEHGESGAPR